MKDKKEREPAPVRRGRFTEQIWSVQSVMVHRSSRKFTPPTDVIEFPDRLVVLAEIAGMRTSDFQIALHNRQLAISGFRDRPPFDNPAYHRVEIGFGEFRIEVDLPWPVLQDQVTASYGDGFLQVDLPRMQPEHMTSVDVIDMDEEEDTSD